MWETISLGNCSKSRALASGNIRCEINREFTDDVPVSGGKKQPHAAFRCTHTERLRATQHLEAHNFDKY